MVKVFGPGVERSGLKANEPTHFTVDCSGAGDGKVHTDAITGHSLSQIYHLPFLLMSTILDVRDFLFF